MVAKSVPVNPHFPQDRREPTVRVGMQEALRHVFAERCCEVRLLTKRLAFHEKSHVAVEERAAAVAGERWRVSLDVTSDDAELVDGAGEGSQGLDRGLQRSAPRLACRVLI